MEFVSALQTAAYIALIAAIVTNFIVVKSAYLNVQELRRRPRRFQSPIPYERFEFNLDD